AALALMASFLGVAGLYVMLDAGFLAAAQLLVYIGAISILIIFAIMLTRRMMQTDESPFNSQPGLGGATAVLVFSVIVFIFYRARQLWPWEADPNHPFGMQFRDDYVNGFLQASINDLGRSFVAPDAFVLPFEIASVLLLAALIGSIWVAWPKSEDGS
ncbi:MAG: NADH-quinone oxidoreductase subunit J, partial [Chloroflexi bacterium]|nr:NADH-quinone oxidoreductase subunit J [Chloroflexota bacterium]